MILITIFVCIYAYAYNYAYDVILGLSEWLLCSRCRFV